MALGAIGIGSLVSDTAEELAMQETARQCEKALNFSAALSNINKKGGTDMKDSIG